VAEGWGSGAAARPRPARDVAESGVVSISGVVSPAVGEAGAHSLILCVSLEHETNVGHDAGLKTNRYTAVAVIL
jgi:hypothetical protein